MVSFDSMTGRLHQTTRVIATPIDNDSFSNNSILMDPPYFSEHQEKDFLKLI